MKTSASTTASHWSQKHSDRCVVSFMAAIIILAVVYCLVERKKLIANDAAPKAEATRGENISTAK